MDFIRGAQSSLQESPQPVPNSQFNYAHPKPAPIVHDPPQPALKSIWRPNPFSPEVLGASTAPNPLQSLLSAINSVVNPVDKTPVPNDQFQYAHSFKLNQPMAQDRNPLPGQNPFMSSPSAKKQQEQPNPIQQLLQLISGNAETGVRDTLPNLADMVDTGMGRTSARAQNSQSQSQSAKPSSPMGVPFKDKKLEQIRQNIINYYLDQGSTDGMSEQQYMMARHDLYPFDEAMYKTFGDAVDPTKQRQFDMTSDPTGQFFIPETGPQTQFIIPNDNPNNPGNFFIPKNGPEVTNFVRK